MGDRNPTRVEDVREPGGGAGDAGVAPPAGRASALVATPGRLAASTAALGVLLVVAARAYIGFVHASRPLSSYAGILAVAFLVTYPVIYAILRAEESRLARELRVARTGTPTLRGLVARRRAELPFLSRFLGTRLGLAAVLLADGDRDAAVDALRASSAFMRGGRLERLRELIDADIERATGTSVGLERCVQRLRAAAPLGHREADLYQWHVLVKAVLQQADGETGLELARELDGPDDEQRVYRTWLCVWFELDLAWLDEDGRRAESDVDPMLTSPSESDLRVAALLARSSGAEPMIAKLGERLSGIARPHPQE